MSSTGGFYRFLEWIVRFVYINLLWILFSLFGLIAFGFAPATASLFAIVRKWITGEKDIAIFPYFFRIFKESFLQTNILFYLSGAFGFSLYFYGQLIQSFSGVAFATAYTIWFSVILLFVVILLYLFPVFVHFDLNTFMYFKYALLIGITSPVQSLLMAANTFAITFLFLFIPTLLPFIFGSVLSFTLMWIAMRSFNRLSEVRKKETEQ